MKSIPSVAVPAATETVTSVASVRVEVVTFKRRAVTVTVVVAPSVTLPGVTDSGD